MTDGHRQTLTTTTPQHLSEKQVAIGQGTEYIRVSGVVNPYFVNAANSISSSQLADARIEFKESGAGAEAQAMAWLTRFFMNVLPF